MTFVATTVGTGPFQPAIRLDAVVYVHHQSYANEDQAYRYAQKWLISLHDHATVSLCSWQFAPSAKEANKS